MRTLVVDVGCSNTKVYVFAEHCRSVEQIYNARVETDQSAEAVVNCVGKLTSKFNDCEKTIVLSYGDALWYEDRFGNIFKMPVEQHAFLDGLPDYKDSGKPDDWDLKGMGNQLLWLKGNYDLSQFRRILPCSTMVASILANNPDWKTWDWVHASNSGMYGYDRGCWLPQMSPFIDAGLIDEKVVSPKTIIPSSAGEVLLGGMDTTFVVSNHIPYSNKPYLSCGTWVTASVESDIETLKPGSAARFVLSPNGTTLKQLCFKSDHTTADRINKFFENRISKVAVEVFGPWSDMLLPEFKFNYEYVERPDRSYLHYQAAKFAMEIPHDIPVNPNVVGDPIYSCQGA